MKLSTKKLVLSGLFIAIGFLLPFLTGQIPQIGGMLSPMHIPVLLCGFICGWQYGLIVGVITPLLRSLTMGMPPLFPTAVAMAFELAAYGALSGLLYALLPKKTLYLYITLISSMLGGRIVWGGVMFCLLAAQGGAFTFTAFAAGAFINAWPGIILHIVLIPILLIALQKAKLIPLRAGKAQSSHS